MRGCVAFVLMIASSCYAQDLQWPTALHNPFVSLQKNISQQKTAVITLHYADAQQVQSLLTRQSNHILEADSIVIAQPKQHRLVIQASAAEINAVRKIIKAIDCPQQQLLLKARIVSVDDKFVRDLGVLFESAKKGVSVTGGVGNFALPIANLGNGQLLDVRLKALEKNGHAQLISAPQVVTLNHQQATIESGEEVPYQQETANGGTSVAFKKAVLKLQVTPHILEQQHVLLELQVNQDRVSALTVQGVPAIHTQQLITQVELKDKQTFALGGIFESTDSHQHEGIPLLKDIPGLGYLFRNHQKVHDKREMLVFVTVDVL